MWAIFDDEQGILHVVPCDEEGEVSPPHILEQFCPCHPVLEYSYEEGSAILKHNHLH